MASSSWDEVEAPVLRWVAEEVPYEMQVKFERGVVAGENPLPDRSDDDIVEAVLRLIEHGLLSRAHVQETIGGWYFTRLRVTADGYRVLGEWPPVPEVQINHALADVLRRLAGVEGSSDEGEQGTLRRAAGTLARFTAGTVVDAAADELAEAGEDFAR